MSDELVDALKGLDEGRNPPAAARTELERRPTAELVPLLGSTELNDAARLALLAALNRRADRSDVAALARVSRKQRARVVSPTLALLERIGGPEAAFALWGSLGVRDDDAGAAARAAGERVAAADESCRVVREGDRAQWPALEPSELGFALLFVAPAALEPLRALGADDPVATAAAAALERLDADARVALQANSQSEHDATVRNAVYDAVLIAAPPVHASIRERAEELLMRRPAAEIEQVLRSVDRPTRLRYVERVLRPEHRERRADRVLLALAVLAAEDPSARETRRPEIIACLGVDDEDVRVAAASALLRDFPEAATVRRILAAAREMDQSHRRSTYRALAPRGVVADLVPADAMLEWATAGAEDRAERRAVVFGRMRDAPPAELPSWIDAGADVDDENLAAALVARLKHAISAHDLRATIAGIAQHPRAPLTLIANLDQLADFDPATAQDILVGLHAADPWRAERFTALLAAVCPPPLVDVRRQAIVQVVANDPRVIAAAASALGDGGRQELLGLTLVALHSVHSTISRLEAVDGTEQLDRHRDRVTAAIDSASESARGNDMLVEQLAAIRRVISRAGEPPPQLADDETRAARSALANDHPGVVEAPSASEPLVIRTDAPIDELVRVAAELGQRVLAPRGAAAGLRRGLQPDLERVVDAVSAAAEIDPRRPLGRLQPALEQRIWARWASRAAQTGRSALAESLEALDGPASRAALMQVDALAAALPSDRLATAVEHLAPDSVTAALAQLQRALSFRERRLAALRAEELNADLTALEQLADRLAPSLAAIEDLLAGYFRLREELDAVGLERAEPALGAVISREQIDKRRHIIADGADENADAYLVRTHGLRVRDGRVRQALLQPIDSEGMEESS